MMYDLETLPVEKEYVDDNWKTIVELAKLYTEEVAAKTRTFDRLADYEKGHISNFAQWIRKRQGEGSVDVLFLIDEWERLNYPH
jgi:rubrerythrin